MRATLGAGLLLASTVLVGVAVTPAEAATECESPANTTWTGTPNGSMSWADEANWSNGVPTASSSVCIPYTGVGPEVPVQFEAKADVIDASGASVTLTGTLTIGTSFNVASLVADGGTLVGGTTTVTNRLTGGLTLQRAAVLDQWGIAELGDWMAQGSRITVHGTAELAPGAEIDTLGGLFTIDAGASLTFDTPNESADVVGGFANHGEVTVTAGSVFMMGAGGPGSGHHDEFSDGTFTAAPDADLSVAYTELRTGALLEHLTWVDHITVPAAETATIADSTIYWDPAEPEPNLTGAGELVATDHSRVGGRIGGSLILKVPAGEVVSMGEAVVQDQALVRVDGELAQVGDINLDDEARLDVHGVHRVAHDVLVNFSDTDPGVEIIHPEGQLLADQDGGLVMVAPFVNAGTVDSGAGQIYLGPRVESPSPSSGIFRAARADTLLLGSNVLGDPRLTLDQAIVEGDVAVGGEVLAIGLDLRGRLTTRPTGQLTLSGTTTLNDGSSIAGEVTVDGQLEADLGADGTAALNGAAVTGQVHVTSGTLTVLGLAPPADGTLTGGDWSVAPGAKLALPGMTTNNAKLTLEGAGASVGGLTGLDNGPDGIVELQGGVDLRLPGRFRNEGIVRLSPGSRLITGANFRQFSTGSLVTEVAAIGRGRVRAEGRRDLAGELVIQPDPAYTPPVDTMRTFLASNGRADPDDAFDSVVSPTFESRKFRVRYERDHVRLWVDRVG